MRSIPVFATTSGIGLAIVKKLVQRHGGEIHVEGRDGQGARFVFTWPVGDVR